MKGRWIEVARHDAPAGLGTTPRKHRDGRWYAASSDGKRMLRFHAGLGAIDTTTPAGSAAYTAATLVVNYFASNPCTQSPISVVSDFQTAYNAAGGSGQVTVDGQYGGNTQAALQEVLSATAGSATAPQNCFQGVVVNGEDYGQVPATPALDATTPNVLGQQVIPGSGGTLPVDWTPVWIGAGVVGVLGILGYAVWTKRHHHRR